jgi:threonine synthase
MVPSSAVILPAIGQLRREGRITAGQTVVACVTGSGFRETTVSMALRPPHPITITPEDGLRTLATFALGKEARGLSRRGSWQSPEGHST